MAEETNKTTTTETPAPADGAAAEPPAAMTEAAPDATPPVESEPGPGTPTPEMVPAIDLEARVAELDAEASLLKDKLLRALAETENVRRRAARDREEASKYAIANFAREMLSVADNLRRALDHIDAEARKGSETVEALVSGVEMTERAMLAALERFGITPIEAMGRKFDHNFHEAMFEVDDPSQPVGTVVHEMERGYMLEDRLLRPARVGVAKGGPAAARAAEAATADDSADAKAAAKNQRAAYEKQADPKGDAGPKVDQKT